VTTIAWGLGALFVLAVILVVVALVAISRIDLGIHGRDHLDPIPIAKEACPYVIVMHAAATEFQRVYPFPTHTVHTTEGWSEQRGRLAAASGSLEQAIKIGSPHFPKPVRARLTTTVRALRRGDRELLVASSGDDLVGRTLQLYADGVSSYGEASDLVGGQCGTWLRADGPPLLETSVPS
jgi:hypothetical protein